jgi:predicted O-methyltransferase YrrM
MKYFISIVFMFSVLQAENIDHLKMRIKNTLHRIEGWCSAEKAENFIDLIMETKPSLYVEIGTYGGSSLVPVALTLKFLNKGHVVTIDPWDKAEAIRYFDPIKDEQHLNWWSRINYSYIYDSYLHNLKKYGIENFVTTLKMTSEQATQHIPNEIDILYLDGNHTEYASLQDVLLYLPKVRVGGYIWINDALWEEHRKATEWLKGTCTLVKSIDRGNCLLFQK